MDLQNKSMFLIFILLDNDFQLLCENYIYVSQKKKKMVDNTQNFRYGFYILFL